MRQWLFQYWYLPVIYLLTINLLGFFSMRYDKKRAKQHAWRVKETTLFLIAAAGGALGSFCGMRRFHHKTRHAQFRYGMPALLLLQLILAGLVLWRIY